MSDNYISLIFQSFLQVRARHILVYLDKDFSIGKMQSCESFDTIK